MATAPAQGAEAIERLRQLPGGPQVLRLAASRDDVELVGGAVRDLLLGVTPREIDLVLDGSPASFPDAAALFARDLSALLADAGEQPQVSVHERFGTAAVRWSGGRVDIAARRAEHYPHPGALPQVGPGTPEQDLQRRDFTVNAIAIRLGGEAPGTIRALDEALGDLQARQLRVLHDASFADDPTRLLRLGRYAARLGFAVEAHTATLAQQALADGFIRTVSAARVGAELRLATREPDLQEVLGGFAELGVLAALDPPMRLDAPLLAQALSLLPADGRPDLLALGCLLMAPFEREEVERETLFAALERFEHPASERRPVLDATARARSLSREIALAKSPSALWELLCDLAVEPVALAGALAGIDGDLKARAAVEDWLRRLRHVRLQIGGEDLLAAGLSAGPEIGERLRTALHRRLDGAIPEGREAELDAALGR